MDAIRARWRSASTCYRASVAEFPAIQPLSFCCRDTARAPAELCDARRHRGFARLVAARRVRFVAAPTVTGFLLAAPSPQPDSAAPEPPRIRSRFVVRERCPARRNRAIFEKHRARLSVPVFPAAARIAL